MALFAALLAAVPAESAPKPMSAKDFANQQAARTMLERGREQLRSGEPAQALASFSAARPLEDSLPLEQAVAEAYLALGKPVEARAALAGAIDRFATSAKPPDLAAARAKLDSLRAACADLELVINQPDTDVALDGVSVGRSPLGRQLLNPGRHRLELKKSGFVPQASDVELKAGPSLLSFALVAEVLQGKLSVTSSGAAGAAELLVNGKVVGLLPWQGTLPVGSVTLVARAPEASSVPVTVVIDSQAPQSVALELKQNTGKVAVNSPFMDVQISVDGAPVGVQSWSGPLPVGRHRLLLSRAGYVSQEQQLDVSSNATTTVTVGSWVAEPGKANEPALESAPSDEGGLYVRLDLGGTIGQTKNGISAHCNESPSNATCSDTGPIGPLLGLRAGYRFGWLAPELFGIGTLDLTYVKASYAAPSTALENDFYGPARREDYTIFRYGLAAGVAARATTLGRTINATGSVGFGVFSQAGRYARASTSSSQVAGSGISVPSAKSSSSSTESSVAPGFVFDGGVLIGSSPGTKLYLGVILSIELAPEDSRVRRIDTTLGRDAMGQPVPYGTPAVNIAPGTQVHFGPVLGFQFGS